MSDFQYQRSQFNFKPCPELAELFTEFVNNIFKSKLSESIDRNDIKKELIFQYFLGAFPELTNFSPLKKEGLIREYNLMTDWDKFIDRRVEGNLLTQSKKTGGSKKNKQVHKKKSKKLEKLKK